ncbi:MAG: amidohydrolase family protein [Nitrospinales bacterium]
MADTIKIKFGYLLTMQGEEIRGGELVVETGIIRSLGRVSGEPSIDLSDCLVLPGFVNAHCHLALSPLRGGKPENFVDWALALVEQEQAATREEKIRRLTAGAETLVRSGVTTLADYLSQPELLDEYTNLPFRQVVFLEALGFKGSLAGGIVKGLESVLQTSAFPEGRRRLGLAPHAPYSVAPALYRELRRLADRHGLPFSSHVAELPEEMQFLQDGSGDLRRLLKTRGVYDDAWKPPGATPLQYLDDLEVMDALTAIHLNYIEDDMNLLVANFVAGVFCPQSTRWFGRQQWMDVRKLLNGGIQVGIGTDSLASNDSLNFFRELRAAEEMLPGVSRREILEMATWRGAEALGLKTGYAAPGMPADLIGLRVANPPASLYDVPFGAGRNQVDFAMIDGEVILEKQP